MRQSALARRSALLALLALALAPAWRVAHLRTAATLRAE